MNLRPKRNPPLRPESRGWMVDEKTGIYVRPKDTILVNGKRTHRRHRNRGMEYKGPIIQPDLS